MTGARAGGERPAVLMFEYRHHQHLVPMAMCVLEHLVSVFVLVPLPDVQPNKCPLVPRSPLPSQGR